MARGASPPIGTVPVRAVSLARPRRTRSRLNPLLRPTVHSNAGGSGPQARTVSGRAYVLRASARIATGVARMPLQPMVAAINGFADGAGGVLTAAGYLVRLVPSVVALCVLAIPDGTNLANLPVDRVSGIAVLVVFATFSATRGTAVLVQAAACPATFRARGIQPARKRAPEC